MRTMQHRSMVEIIGPIASLASDRISDRSPSGPRPQDYDPASSIFLCGRPARLVRVATETHPIRAQVSGTAFTVFTENESSFSRAPHPNRPVWSPGSSPRPGLKDRAIQPRSRGMKNLQIISTKGLVSRPPEQQSREHCGHECVLSDQIGVPNSARVAIRTPERDICLTLRGRHVE